MKKIFRYSAIVVALFFTSCEDYLTTTSPSSFTQDYIFSSETDATRAVNAIYALFNQDAYTSRLSNNFMGNTDIEMGGASSSAGDNGRRDIWTFEAREQNSDVRVVWNNAYMAINRANEAIEGIEASQLYKDGNPMMQQLLGEAKGLRAFWYYYLVNLWGDVPFFVTATKAGDDFYKPRTSRYEILSYIIQDLIGVEPNMMWAEQVPFGVERMNREFIMGLIARIALTRGGYSLHPDMTMKRNDDYLEYYQIANTYTKKLRDLKPHILNPSFAQVFRNQAVLTAPENAPAVPTSQADILYEVAFHPGFGDVAWNHGIKVDAGTHPYGSGSNYTSLTVNYYYSFDTLDTRQDVTASLIYYDKELLQQPVAVSSIAPGKWNRLWLKTPPGPATAKGTGINWPVMRYADVLLMLAETDNELNGGPTADAIEALKKVRRRAFPESTWPAKVDQYVASVSGSKDAFFDALVDERAWELGAEAIRKYDLIRWNLYGDKVAETKETLYQMGLDALNQTGQYAYLPRYLYYKRNPDGTITFLNKYRSLAVAPPLKDSPNVGDNPDGYSRQTWLLGNINSTTMEPANYILYNWRGYQDPSGQAPVPYILPIPSETVLNSQGVLRNDGYNF
ncbi:RagB/SusD family nutrient uptake outer membrane protein [Botryobacter ruber]|uniref:RagB/SusD family nutrient uptake outer membrane protein n=1 Tax=Botryobacter ruber TaxID=2171629 RepID=UPI000E0C380B|nr:RagB/SusD family nutrient uptake outer membrane protein [Botryobacter ruber]